MVYQEFGDLAKPSFTADDVNEHPWSNGGLKDEPYSHGYPKYQSNSLYFETENGEGKVDKALEFGERAGAQITVDNAVKVVNSDTHKGIFQNGGGMGTKSSSLQTQQKEDLRGEESEQLASSFSSGFTFSVAEINTKGGGTQQKVSSTKRRSPLQGPPVFHKTRKSRRKHHLTAHGRLILKPIPTRELSPEPPLRLLHPSLFVKFSVERRDQQFIDKVDLSRKAPEHQKNGNEGNNMEPSKEVNGPPALLGRGKALFDIFIIQPDDLNRKTREEIETQKESPSAGEVDELNMLATALSVEEKNVVFSVTKTEEVDRTDEDQERTCDDSDRVDKEELTVNQSQSNNGREFESTSEELVLSKSKCERVLEERTSQNKAVYRMPEESLEQQRSILFWFAGLVVQAIGFELKLSFQALSTLMLLCNYLYSFVSNPVGRILQVKGKFTEKNTQVLDHVTELSLGFRELLSSLQPVLKTGAKKMGFGFLTATYVFFTLSLLFVASFALSFFLVKSCIHEPIQIKKVLHFDYTKPHPVASLDLLPSMPSPKATSRSKAATFPENKFRISLLLTLPESDYNRQLGIFQVTAELLSLSDKVLVNTSQPCMLRFKSTTLRRTKLLFMAIPLLTGFSYETQTLVLQLLEWREEKTTPSASVRVLFVPRAGSSMDTGLPELYRAEIYVESELPWMLSIVRTWRWTLVVWTGFSLFIGGLLVILCTCRQILLPNVGSGLIDTFQAIQNDLKLNSEAMDSKPNQEYKKQISLQDECLSLPPDGLADG